MVVKFLDWGRAFPQKHAKSADAHVPKLGVAAYYFVLNHSPRAIDVRAERVSFLLANWDWTGKLPSPQFDPGPCIGPNHAGQIRLLTRLRSTDPE